MMSQVEAWKLLAKNLEKAVRGQRSFTTAPSSYSLGLCGAVADLWRYDMITEDTKEAMLDRIPERGVYQWPLGDHASRRAFCLDQIEDLVGAEALPAFLAS